ncbi:MAG: hypothetical protein M3N31_03860 [Actinomycetota bacterium]|nr:hypothetical protein [Actinomycetota bacterium]
MGLEKRKNKRRRMAVMALVGISLTGVTYAVTAANTVPASSAGDGSGVISGYTVSGVDYSLNAANPQSIDSVSFVLSSAPAAGATVKVKLVSSGTSWYSCTMSGTPAVNASCATTGATVAEADQLTVVVAD